MSESPEPNWKYFLTELSNAITFLTEQNQAFKSAYPDNYYAVETDLILADAREATQALAAILMRKNAIHKREPSEPNPPHLKSANI